ncbi:uncharacterized protein LOC110114056 [Dendrobium catenatum]|uniref:uncharacterized protein LOC110114056 n=1 Tax=Dendrobium catenatum TaxID=906689 RepID=UPI0009F3CDC2|nr:uncharacterized protein LOC110114056 [Dendrobium catenatum]
MKQPQGFIHPNHLSHVCKLHKTIYGLKQAPRQWFHTFTAFLQSIGFTFSKSNPSLLFYKKEDTKIYILLYVDDILISGNKHSKIIAFIKELQDRFQLRELGPVSFFLGIQVSRTAAGYFLSQSQYALDILQSAGLADCKPSQTPIAVKTVADAKQFLGSDPRSTGKLLAHCNISQSLDQTLHMLLTLFASICINRPNCISPFSNDYWAADHNDRKSIFGFCTFLGNSLVSWCVKKQATVAKSSTEVEYWALASATSDIIWLRRLLSDFDVEPLLPTILSCDNTSALALANNPSTPTACPCMPCPACPLAAACPACYGLPTYPHSLPACIVPVAPTHLCRIASRSLLNAIARWRLPNVVARWQLPNLAA